MKKGSAGENVSRWFSYCSSQAEFKKVQKMVSNNSQGTKAEAEKQKPSSVCKVFILYLVDSFQFVDLLCLSFMMF